MYQVGDRVIVTVELFGLKEGLATIVYIDFPTLFAHESCPIQVELDEPYDGSGQILKTLLNESLLLFKKCSTFCSNKNNRGAKESAKRGG
ncbi:hypothetical protein ABC255_16865 [Neobacillus sp. 3P2-tot-E-2]|uniref:hypothetical protein n=1 Tax=Neobacillus sp. 3P2-tot-E-2 TaxID=3132212 RepID=UPI0039A0E3E2